MIKDSGERTEFGTGAVRDMHSGKGRMDLLPWEALILLDKVHWLIPVCFDDIWSEYHADV